MSDIALSRREIEVARRYSRGLSYKEIANELSIAPATVRTHINTVYRKLEINNKLALAEFINQTLDDGQRPETMASEARPSAGTAPLPSPADLDHEVEALLDGLGLGGYAPIFAEQAIDMDVLHSLEESDLQALGIQAIGHRKRLLAAIRQDPATAAAHRALVQASPAEATRERRRITILHVGLVGSTELSVRLDPEEFSEALDAYQACVRQVVERFEGHVATIIGDEVIVYFGWPRSNEYEADRALRAGLALHDAIEALPWHLETTARARIGIATGLVVAEEFTDAHGRANAKIAGGTPNLAHRLQALAPPGGVVVVELTRQLTEGRFALEPLDELAIEGFAAPVQAWSVVGEKDWIDGLDAAASSDDDPIIGREHELALILSRWALACSGEGQVVLLSGDPGIGKSRITQAACQAILATGDESRPNGKVQRYYCSSDHSSVAFWPIIVQLTHLAGLHDGEEPDSALDKVEALLAPITAGESKDLSKALIADLLGLDGRSRYAPTMLTPEAKRARTIGVLTEWFVRRAGDEPQLIVVENAHWIDPTTLALLEVLFATIERARVLVLITSRPEKLPTISQFSYLTSLALNRLDLRNMRAMVRRIAGDRLDGQTVDAIVERADGVPLFVEELTKTMLTTGQAHVPESLYASLMARLDRYPSAKGIAQIGSCIGRQFDIDLLIKVAERSKKEIEAATSRLIDAAVILRGTTKDNQVFTFKHVLLQNVAYQNLLLKKRQQVHKKILQAFLENFEGSPRVALQRAGVKELALLANHASGAQSHEEASRYWEQAGRLAAADFAHVEAVQHLGKAIESLELTSGRDGKKRQIRSLLLELVASLRILGRYQQALDALETAEALTESNEALELAKIYYLRGNILFPLGRADDCRASHETALAQAVDAGSAEYEARVLGGLADAAYVHGRMLTAFENFNRCIELAYKNGFAAIAVANLPMRGWGHYYRCDPTAALNDGLAGIDGAVRDRCYREEMLARAASQYFAWELGDTKSSREQCEMADALAKRLGARNFEPFNLLNLALLTVEQDRGEALQIACNAVEMARETGGAFTGPWALGALAVVAEDAEARRRAVEEGLQLLDQGALAHCHYWFYRHTIDASIAAGDWPEVEQLTARLEAFVAPEPLPWISFLIDRARALIAHARQPTDPVTRDKLERLRALAERHHLVVARRAIDAALSVRGSAVG